jgi:hypothetical protein
MVDVMILRAPASQDKLPEAGTMQIKPHAKSAKGAKDGTSGAISCPE